MTTHVIRRKDGREIYRGPALDFSALVARAIRKRVDLSGADLTATVPVSGPWRSYSEGKLEGALFTDRDLTGALFYKANVERADFRRATLDAASLNRVRGRRADFEDAQLLDVSGNDGDFRGASFRGARLVVCLSATRTSAAPISRALFG